MNTKQLIKVHIERGGDGSFGAYIEENKLPYGIIGEGNTVAAAIEDFNTGYEDMREYYAEEGKEFTEATFEFVYDVPSFLQYYVRFFSLAGLAHITGVNQGQLSHYLNGHRRPSDRTAKKIQDALNRFGEDISHVSLV
ncbi:MAG: helix-turn-helix domain-containing protein [Phocaeicola sp.]